MFGRVFSSLGSAVRRAIEPAPQDARRAPRLAGPDVVVYYWDGSTPEGRRLLDISDSGAYICTRERWYLGTIVRLVLQGSKTAGQRDGAAVAEDSVCIPSRVVRQGADGVGVEFLFTSPQEMETVRKFVATIPPQPPGCEGSEPRSGPAAQKGTSGQSLVEFTLILPLIFLIVMNLVNFGGFFFAWITVSGAARSGAQYMARSTASIGKPTAPTAAQVTTVVTNDVASLLNKASLVVRICTNTNGTVSCAGSGTQTPPADPEPSTYVLGSVDVTYTYVPYISQWNFGGLGIQLTLPPTTIHQRSVARIMQ